MRIPLYLLVTLLFLTSSCKYSKLLKGSDSEKQYQTAVQLYEKKDYARALQLFEKVAGVMKATDKAERISYYTAYSYYYMKDYTMASYYFRRYATNFGNQPAAEECAFMSAYCNYKSSPEFSLDQTTTKEAIKDFQVFLNTYPKSIRVSECNDLIDELRAKLELKDFRIAKMYYRMDDYLAAITTLNTLLKEYPETARREEVLFLIFKSNYKYATESIDLKKKERYQKALSAYGDLVALYPDSKFLPEANGLREKLVKEVPVTTIK